MMVCLLAVNGEEPKTLVPHLTNVRSAIDTKDHSRDKLSNSINLYPNPVSRYFVIEYPVGEQNILLRILDSKMALVHSARMEKGRKVLVFEINSHVQVEKSTFN